MNATPTMRYGQGRSVMALANRPEKVAPLSATSPVESLMPGIRTRSMLSPANPRRAGTRVDRDEHGDGHRGGGAQAHHREERDAGDEQAGEGDDHGATGEDDGAARRRGSRAAASSGGRPVVWNAR